MSIFTHFAILGRLWIRISIAVSLVLFFTLAVVVFTVYELTLASERRDLDLVLSREGKAITTAIVSDLTTESPQSPDPVITQAEIREAVSRALALHPGSPLHLAQVRWDNQTLSSARGPDRLMNLRDAAMLPTPAVSQLTSRNGIRSRSQIIEMQNSTITVETMGDDDAIASDARDVAQRTFVASAIGGLLGLIALSVTVRRSTRLITTVSSTVRETQLDNLPHRIPDVGGSHEVAVLARDVNKMLNDLAEARATRNELIASVSHEIRTPLAAARGHTDLLREGRSTDPSVSVTRIDRELTRMTRLVDDLLALSRSSDPSWISSRLVSAQSILDDLRDRLMGLEAQHVDIRPAPDVMIEADSDRLLQAISNLVRNSILHTPMGTPISVSSSVTGTSIEFVVSDEGPGIPEEVLQKFGEAFVRGSESGTGLGLAVARAVAIAHGGSLTVRPHTSGSTIVLSIPIEGPQHGTIH